jgi:hypothetical protein
MIKLTPCLLCGQPVDFQDTTYRHHLFIDGKRYDYLCFTCAHVPEDYIQTTKDDVTQQTGPYFDHKHLRSVATLVDIGAAETPAEAKRSVQAVRQAIKKAGAKLNKLSLNPPKHHSYNILEDDAKPIPAKKKKKKTKKKPAKKEMASQET